MSVDLTTLQVRALQELDLDGLRAAWRAHYGAPPTLRSVDLLRRLLAWRLQAAAFGDLELQTRRKLKSAGSSKERSLTPGARIAREWKGVRHEVAVTERGYLYAGATYDSLSVIAREITGTRWNGPRFFGLRSGA